MKPNQYLFKHPLKRFAASAFDQAGTWLYPLISKKPAGFTPLEVKRILAIRLDHMGDVMMARPALKALADAFPEAAIDLLVSAELAPLLARDSFIHRFIPVRHHWFQRENSFVDRYQDFFKLSQELKHEAYDLGIDFRGDFRNILLLTAAGIPTRLSYSLTGGKFLLTHCGEHNKGLHQVDLNVKLLEKIGLSKEAISQPLLYKDAQKTALIEQYPVLGNSQAKRLIIHMGAGYASKRWQVNHYRELITRIIKLKIAQVLLIGTKSEKSQMPVVEYPKALFDLRGLLSLSDLPILMDVCQFYLGNDSGPAHIAAAQAIPGLILFSGTNEASVWRPLSKNLEIIEKKVLCSPCEAKECPLKHHDCLEQITVDEVFDKLNSFFNSPLLVHP